MATFSTPWGVIDIKQKEFCFRPKFSINNPPYAMDGIFVEEELIVNFKYNESYKWYLSSVWTEENGEVQLNSETLRSLKLQGKFRLNQTLEYIKNL